MYAVVPWDLTACLGDGRPVVQGGAGLAGHVADGVVDESSRRWGPTRSAARSRLVVGIVYMVSELTPSTILVTLPTASYCISRLTRSVESLESLMRLRAAKGERAGIVDLPVLE